MLLPQARCSTCSRWVATSPNAALISLTMKLTACAFRSTSTASARWRKWRLLTCPAHEFPTDQTAIELFRSQWRDRFEVKRDAEHIYQQVSSGRYLPVSNTGNRCSSMSRCRRYSAISPASTLIVNTGDPEASAERFQNEARARFENCGVDPMRPLLRLSWPGCAVMSCLKNPKMPRVQLKTERLAEKRQIPIWATRRR